MPTKPLRIDPIAEARRHWSERWGDEPARVNDSSMSAS
jgi:hypothetical protein